MKTAGLVLDYYDDPNKSVLKSVFPTFEEIPSIVKEAHPLTPEERAVLRDDGYALILQNEGSTLRKFACVDPGNTLLSAIYFAKTAHKLPTEARVVAEANIYAAAERFGVDIHQTVEKTASKGGMSRKRDPMKQPWVGNDADWNQHTNLNSVQGSAQPGGNGMVLDTVSTMKTASRRRVDVTGLEPERQVVTKTASRTALGKYPLDSYADVQKAVSYFEDNYLDFCLEDRHEFAVKTASRAEELGIPTMATLDRYGSTDYSPDIDAHIANRRAIINDQAVKNAYTDLQEKRASVSPDQFVKILSSLDEEAGLNWYWGGDIADPYFATYGGRGVEKQAGWTWQSQTSGDFVNENQIKELATHGHKALKRALSEDAVEGFMKDPITVFESMPEPMKLILCRLANEVAGQLVQS